MKLTRRQRTFCGDECERKAIEWLSKLEGLFHVHIINWKTYEVKGVYGIEGRCKVIVVYYS